MEDPFLFDPDGNLLVDPSLDAYPDLCLMKIRDLKREVGKTLTLADEEAKIIHEWALSTCVKKQERIAYLESELDAYIRARKLKTIDLPHGTLKIRRRPDRVEISDIDEFLSHATPLMLTTIPERMRPDLLNIRCHVQERGEVPPGVSYIKGEEGFSYKLKETNGNGTDEAGSGAESTEEA
jgi:phage host-nuclease inhibitor protein Gam